MNIESAQKNLIYMIRFCIFKHLPKKSACANSYHCGMIWSLNLFPSYYLVYWSIQKTEFQMM